MGLLLPVWLLLSFSSFSHSVCSYDASDCGSSDPKMLMCKVSVSSVWVRVFEAEGSLFSRCSPDVYKKFIDIS